MALWVLCRTLLVINVLWNLRNFPVDGRVSLSLSWQWFLDRRLGVYWKEVYSAPHGTHICKHCHCFQMYLSTKTITVVLSFLFGYWGNEQREVMNMYGFSLLDLIELDHRPVILLQSQLQYLVALLQYIFWNSNCSVLGLKMRLSGCSGRTVEFNNFIIIILFYYFHL